MRLLSPAVAAALNRAKIALAIVPWKQSTAATPKTVVAPAVDSYREELDHSADLIPTFSTALHEARTQDTVGSTTTPIELPISASARSLRSQALESGSPIHNSPAAPPGPESTPSGKLQAVLGGVVLVWLVGVAIGLARLILAARQLARLRGSLHVLDTSSFGEVLSEVRRVRNIDRLPPVYLSDAVSGPVAIGILRGGIVLPRALASTLPLSQLRDVLVHEMAHVWRRDPLIALLQQAAGVLYWPHPLVHHLNVKLTRSREEVCDNFVLQSADPCGYARTLLQLSETFGPGRAVRVGLGLTDTRWTLRDRVEGILDPERNRITKVRPWAAAGLALGLAAICVAIGALRPIEARSEVVESARQASSSNGARTNRPGRRSRRKRPAGGKRDCCLGYSRKNSQFRNHRGRRIIQAQHRRVTTHRRISARHSG